MVEENENHSLPETPQGAPPPPPIIPIDENGLPSIPKKKPDKARTITEPNASAPLYRGLVNQAMTCYLNSLLQTLYMTPEFRRALYNYQDKTIPPTDDPEYATKVKKNIPFQLQRLFVHLNFFTDVRAIETVDMTKSFGWTGADAFQQHDVQELMRVMFDALEVKLKGTEFENIINELYQGSMLDYVKCKHCGYESQREDSFQDMNLAIRPFGSTHVFGSIEEALDDFVKPEVLDGSNQYHCNVCDEKRDAEKGLKVKTLPYLLTIQLKRFDFNYETFQRIKLSDRVEFSTEMEFGKYIVS